MKEFENKTIEKTYQKIQMVLYVGLFILFIGVILFGYSIYKADSVTKTPMYELIANNQEENLYGYIDIDSEPYEFAYYEDDPNHVYFVTDENRIYIAQMSSETYEKIKNATYPIRVEGSTVFADDSLKEVAIESYNEIMEEEEYMLSLEDFDSVFGSIYLNLETTPLTTNDIILVVGFMLGIIGLIVVIVGVFQQVRYKKQLKKLSLEEKIKIQKELQDEKKSFYYEKAQVYLTENYILNLAHVFEAIPYKDVLWIYPYELRYYGFKTAQSIYLITKDGKKHIIASMSVVTKSSKEAMEEIYQTILKKNPKILNGFTKENRQKIKELTKKAS